VNYALKHPELAEPFREFINATVASGAAALAAKRA
jgi:hypothetical protein